MPSVRNNDKYLWKIQYFSFDLYVMNNDDILLADTSSMPFYSWYLFSLQCFVLKYVLRPTAWWSSFFRVMYNNLLRLCLIIAKKYPYFATWKYGEKYSKVDIFRL